MLAYLGYLGGYEYGYEALADDEIYFQARSAMEESALALTRKYHPPAGVLLANVDDLLHRFGNRALGDTILRLGRDPLRKLARTDRLTGAALNALAEGVTPTNLVTGIAAGLCFDHPDDPVARDLRARLHGYGLGRVLGEACEYRAGRAAVRDGRGARIGRWRGKARPPGNEISGLTSSARSIGLSRFTSGLPR